MIIQRRTAAFGETPINQIPGYEQLEKTLAQAGVPQGKVLDAVKGFRGPTDANTGRNLGKADRFFSDLFAPPSIKPPAEIFTTVAPLIGRSITWGGDLDHGLWCFSQALRDFAQPHAALEGLSRIVESSNALQILASGWEMGHAVPEQAQHCLEVLSSQQAAELLNHYYQDPVVWETFLRFSACYPQDAQAKLAYERRIHDRRDRDCPQPADYARRLMRRGEMLSLSIHYGVGVIGVGPSSEAHEGMEKRIGLPDDVRRRIVPATMLQPEEGRPYELILPVLSTEALGGEKPPLPILTDPMKLVTWHLFDQGFDDCIVRIQGAEKFMAEDIMLSQVSGLPIASMPREESVVRVVRAPSDLPKMGYLRLRGGELAALYLLSEDADRKHIGEYDTYCAFQWDKRRQDLELAWVEKKHVVEADPAAILRHVSSRGGDWRNVHAHVREKA